MNETYRFEISPQYQIISWTPYTSKYANIYEEMKKENSFTFMADAYFKAFNSGETLYDLFYSTAQAAQFFPALADDVHYAGNNVVAFQTPFLQTAPGFRSWEFDPGYQQGLVYAKRDIGAGVSVFQEKIIHQPCFSKIYVNDKTVSQYAEVVTKNAYCHKDIFLTKKAHFFLVYDNGGSLKDKIVFTLKDFIRELKNAAGSIDLPGMKTCEFDPGYLSEVTINGNTQTYSCTELMEIYREREAVSNIQSEKDLVELINIPTQVECEVNINGEMKPGKEIIFHPVLTLRLRQFPHLINLTVQPAYLNGMTVKLISPDGFLYSQIIGSDGKEKGSFIKIYTAHYPYNKMTEYLIPMSLGGNLKLLKNFFQSDFIK
ncbi:MAG TPA: hypothetical protein DHW82_05880 [Spirochaetia bacterium]|nr:hypothetical protein [Spirochaetia bacterium]